VNGNALVSRGGKETNASGAVLLERGQYCYLKDEPAVCAYRVLDGAMLLESYASSGGKKIGFWVIRPGETFGDESLRQSALRRHDAVALEPTSLLKLDAWDAHHAALVEADARARLSELEDRWLVSAVKQVWGEGSRHRCVEYILRLYPDVALTDGTVACLTGYTRETVCKARSRLRKRAAT
jgi:CRP-like cAMP-binding protein